MSDHLFSLQDLCLYDFNYVFDLSEDIKKNPRDYRDRLKHQTFAFLFTEETLYGRLLLGTAAAQMGGTLIPLPWTPSRDEKPFGTRAWSGNLGEWVNGWIFSGFSTERMKEMASNLTIPVLNASSDQYHPCRVLADFYTIKEAKGSLNSLRIGYIGEWSNICWDLIVGALYSEARLVLPLSDPEGKEGTSSLDDTFPDWRASIEWSEDPLLVTNTPDVIFVNNRNGKIKEGPTNNIIRTEKTTSSGETRLPTNRREVIRLFTDPYHDADFFQSENMDPSASFAAERLKNQLHVQKAIMLLLDTKRR